MKRTRLTNPKLLDKFFCGIKEMDDFIHERLWNSVDSHFCVPYIIYEGNTVVAFFALSYDSLVFDSDYLDDFMNGFSSSGKPFLKSEYLDTFVHKEHYPAIDIAYFAVNKDYQGNNIGSMLIEDIVNQVKQNDFAGCQFIVVDALVTREYNAVGFYAKNGFTVCEDLKAQKDCVRMYRVLYPQE